MGGGVRWEWEMEGGWGWEKADQGYLNKLH